MIQRFAFLISILFIFSCSSDTSSTDFINLNQDFEISLNQHLTENGSFPTIFLQTSNLVDCSESSLVTNNSQNAQGIEITIKDISVGDDCSGFSYPNSRTNILLENGRYAIVVQIENVLSNDGFLNIDSETYSLEMTTTDGLEIGLNQINRIQSELIWGHILSTEENVEEVYEVIYGSIQHLAQERHDMSMGHYGFFQIDRDGEQQQIQVENAPINEFSYHFIWEHKGDLILLQERLNELRNSHPNLTISAKESSGQDL